MRNEIANLEYGKNYNKLTKEQQKEVDYQIQETQEDAIIYDNMEAYLKMLDIIYDKSSGSNNVSITRISPQNNNQIK